MGMSLTGGLLGLGSAMATASAATAASSMSAPGGGGGADDDGNQALRFCEGFCKPRNCLLSTVGEFLAFSSQRVKHLCTMVPDVQFRTPDLLDNKSFIVLLHTFLYYIHVSLYH